MADVYVSKAGTIQWEPRDKVINGGDCKTFTIRLINDPENRQVDVTLWPELAHAEVKKGDFVVVDGKATVRVAQAKDGEERTFYNISATALSVVPCVERKAREVANKKSKAAEEVAF